MATHSSTLAWKIPWMEEPGRLQSMGSLRVRQDWVTSLLLFTFMPWRRKWQPTPVLLPGESQGRGSLVGCNLWGCTESDMTEATWQQQQRRTNGTHNLDLWFILILARQTCLKDPQTLSGNRSILPPAASQGLHDPSNEHYSLFSKQETFPFATSWMNLRDMM